MTTPRTAINCLGAFSAAVVTLRFKDLSDDQPVAAAAPIRELQTA
jgi:hypothetical protein